MPDLSRLMENFKGKIGAPLYNLVTSQQRTTFKNDLENLLGQDFSDPNAVYSDIYQFFDQKFQSFMKTVVNEDERRNDHISLFNFMARESTPGAIAHLKMREGGDRHNWFLAMLARSVNTLNDEKLRQDTIMLMAYGFTSDISHQTEFANALDHLIQTSSNNTTEDESLFINALTSIQHTKLYIASITPTDKSFAINALLSCAQSLQKADIVTYLTDINQNNSQK